MAHRGERLLEQVQQEAGWNAFHQSQIHRAAFTGTIRDTKLIFGIESATSATSHVTKAVHSCPAAAQAGKCLLSPACIHAQQSGITMNQTL